MVRALDGWMVRWLDGWMVGWLDSEIVRRVALRRDPSFFYCQNCSSLFIIVRNCSPISLRLWNFIADIAPLMAFVALVNNDEHW